MAEEEPMTVRCRECGETLATVGRTGGVYPLPSVRVYIERGKVVMFCPTCNTKRRWPIAKAA